MQERIVRSLVAGRDACVIMPTGGGKSLCYQLPAVISGGTTVVISPLIALMQDQATQLAQMGIPAAVLNSATPFPEQGATMRAAAQGAYRLLYLSPERLQREDSVPWLSRVPVTMFAIDEAHCISEWGHEFRPDYRQLSRLREAFPQKAIAAFTASATRQVRHDILAQLRLRDPDKFITSFHRSNLRYIVQPCDRTNQTTRLFAALQQHAGSNVIVYASTINAVEATESALRERGIAAVAYHGKMDAATRRRNQELWMSDEAPVIVGTLAFGLGINKPSVRAVIHLSLPKSIEQYYQEAGRAGRDGQPADCLLLWQARDVGVLVHFIQEIQDSRERELSWSRYRAIRRFVDSEECRHWQVCRHFGETPKWTNCGACDICSKRPDWLDVSGPPPDIRVVAPVVSKARTAAPVAEVDAELVAHMKRWRRGVAEVKGVPAYVILHDASLVEICRRQPRDSSELLQITGIGERKAEMYGRQIVDALRAYGG